MRVWWHFSHVETWDSFNIFQHFGGDSSNKPKPLLMAIMIHIFGYFWGEHEKIWKAMWFFFLRSCWGISEDCVPSVPLVVWADRRLLSFGRSWPGGSPGKGRMIPMIRSEGEAGEDRSSHSGPGFFSTSIAIIFEIFWWESDERTNSGISTLPRFLLQNYLTLQM